MAGNALDTATITWMRSWVENNVLPDTCHIMSKTLASDGMGNSVVTWGTATANVPCRLDTYGNPVEGQIGGGIEPFRQWILTIPYNETISVQNRILHDGITYEVTGVDDDKSWPVTIGVYLEPING